MILKEEEWRRKRVSKGVFSTSRIEGDLRGESFDESLALVRDRVRELVVDHPGREGGEEHEGQQR